jgi:hypothetical protein
VAALFDALDSETRAKTHMSSVAYDANHPRREFLRKRSNRLFATAYKMREDALKKCVR